jgi:hypothetical protein
MDPKIRSGTARPVRTMPAESQALHRVRYVAKVPANPFPFVYDCNTILARDISRLRPFVETIPARDRHPTGLILSDRARPPAQEHQAPLNPSIP